MLFADAMARAVRLPACSPVHAATPTLLCRPLAA